MFSVNCSKSFKSKEGNFLFIRDKPTFPSDAFGDFNCSSWSIKGTLMHIWKSANISAFIWKQYVEDFTLKHPCFLRYALVRQCEKFVYKYSETIVHVKN